MHDFFIMPPGVMWFLKRRVMGNMLILPGCSVNMFLVARSARHGLMGIEYNSTRCGDNQYFPGRTSGQSATIGVTVHFAENTR
jgi:hypothetical protein